MNQEQADRFVLWIEFFRAWPKERYDQQSWCGSSCCVAGLLPWIWPADWKAWPLSPPSLKGSSSFLYVDLRSWFGITQYEANRLTAGVPRKKATQLRLMEEVLDAHGYEIVDARQGIK